MFKKSLDINCKIRGNKLYDTHVDHLTDGKGAIQMYREERPTYAP